jgi:hypothetical protein
MANRALLVGINAYNEVPLRGCVNDVMDIRDLLSAKCGFSPTDIRIITDAKATTANIKEQLEGWLLHNVLPGDRLLFHFSGHGTQLPGRDGVVHDVVCPVDFDFTEQHALSDVDFSALFKSLPANVEFNWISDSCHSGDLARGLAKPHVVPRYWPPPPPIAAQINALRTRRATTRSLDGAIERLKGVLIAGCQSDETSADAVFDGRFNGALSYYLIKELGHEVGLSQNVDTLVENVRSALGQNGYDQHPQIRGLPELLAKPFLAAHADGGGAVAGGGSAASAPATSDAARDAARPIAIEREGDGKFWDDSFEEAAHPDVVSRGEEGWAKVHWTKNDEESSEYRHIANNPLKGSTFDFSADDLEGLIKANAFEPLRDRGKIIFGLRGAQLIAAAGAGDDDRFRQIGRPVLHLRETRPDHQHFLCVIGVYDVDKRQLSGFIASTVPCRQAVYNYANGGQASNMLPSGCYRLVVGPHNGRIGCLREDEDFTVLRTPKDYVFDTKDVWDNNFPADDLHPAFANASAQFSSWGCQTVRGDCPKGTDSFSGEYKDFRHELGLLKRGTGDYGLKFSYVMLTGLEAAMAHSGPNAGELMRLRHGSRGERVKALQHKLGLAEDGVFSSQLTKALADYQKKVLGWADAIYGPEMDRLLKFDIFAPAPAAVAAATAAPRSLPSDAAIMGVSRGEVANKSGFPWRGLILISGLLVGLALLMFNPVVRSGWWALISSLLK